MGRKWVRCNSWLCALLVGCVGPFFGGENTSAIGQQLSPAGARSTYTSSPPNPCGMQLNSSPPIFCDTFDIKNPGTPSRTGDLDPDVWGVSRLSGDYANLLPVAPTELVGCNGTKIVLSPRDVIICNGQLRQATNDRKNVTVLAMYPKQPFDFSGRTGTVSFDVSNDTQGSHAAWPEFWITDTPVPAPFNHFDSWLSLPKDGLGVRFAANGEVGQYGSCPNGKNLDKRRFTVDSAVVIRNYAYEDTRGYGVASGLKLTIFDCVVAASGPNGPLNHIEIRVSQNQIEVWASDAGSTTLRRIAAVTNANLSFTRGLVWLEDVHYNAAKGACPPNYTGNPTCQDQQTFTWDNLAFDGPFTYRDFSYDALDSGVVNNDGAVQLAKSADPNRYTSWNVLNMPANPQPAAVRVLFNWTTWLGAKPSVINVRVNGHMHSLPYPYPANDSPFGVTSWRTLPVTIRATNLVPGTNLVEIGTDQKTFVSNVNIVLVDVPGGVPVLPGSNNAYPGSLLPAPTPSPVPVPTPGLLTPYSTQ